MYKSVERRRESRGSSLRSWWIEKSRPLWVFSRVTVRVVGVFVRRSGAGAKRWERRRAMGWSGGWRGVGGILFVF